LIGGFAMAKERIKQESRPAGRGGENASVSRFENDVLWIGRSDSHTTS
jgi:hypothetical protein